MAASTRSRNKSAGNRPANRTRTQHCHNIPSPRKSPRLASQTGNAIVRRTRSMLSTALVSMKNPCKKSTVVNTLEQLPRGKVLLKDMCKFVMKQRYVFDSSSGFKLKLKLYRTRRPNSAKRQCTPAYAVIIAIATSIQAPLSGDSGCTCHSLVLTVSPHDPSSRTRDCGSK